MNNEEAVRVETDWRYSRAYARLVRVNSAEYWNDVNPCEASRSVLEAAERAWAKGEGQ